MDTVYGNNGEGEGQDTAWTEECGDDNLAFTLTVERLAQQELCFSIAVSLGNNVLKWTVERSYISFAELDDTLRIDYSSHIESLPCLPAATETGNLRDLFWTSVLVLLFVVYRCHVSLYLSCS